MTTRSNKNYPKEFKEEAIKLALNSNSIRDTAHSLGIPSTTLHSWVQKAKRSGVHVVSSGDSVINHVNVGTVLEENKELKKRLVRLEKEKEILKKAASYFAKELD